MPPQYIRAAQEEVERVTKRQRMCAGNVETLLNDVILKLETAMASSSGDIDVIEAVSSVQNRFAGHTGMHHHYGELMALHSSVAKLGKVVDKHFTLDISKAVVAECDLNPRLVDKIIVEHLFHDGLFDVGETYAAEANVPNSSALSKPYSAMHVVLQEIKKQNLAPLLQWVVEHEDELQGPNKEPSKFEFQIRQLEYLQLLEKQGQDGALAYARLHFPRFYTSCGVQLRRLMGALTYVKQPHGNAPYADLFKKDLWSDLELEFVRQSCALLGQAQDSPLLVTVAAGATALPTLLKLAAVVPIPVPPSGEITPETYQLQVEIPLGSEFIFNSIFACPVSKDQSTPDNPPVMLPCGHCMCRQSIMKIAKTMNRSFKCPYCPAETTAAMCTEIIFPDVE